MLLARIKQFEKDIKKMNDVANAGARAKGYCNDWENIMAKINKETQGRLGLMGRVGYNEVVYTPPAPRVTACDCAACRPRR
jgi:hypothetical protein